MTATALEIDHTISSAWTTACAKINLTLEILGRRDDGFHQLRSLVVGAGLHDRVRCTRRRSPGIELVCNDDSLRTDDNLVMRAARALARHAGIKPSLRIELEKTIPIGAGLGGGSSDAAATLRLCDHIWRTSVDLATLENLGGQLGSDVPLFLSLPSVVMTGRGERVRPVTMAWNGWALLVHPAFPVATAEVYRAWRPTDGLKQLNVDADKLTHVTSADELNGTLINQLEPAVFRVAPGMEELADRLADVVSGPFRVSGTGSTLFRLFDHQEAARDAAAEIHRLDFNLSTSVVAAPVGESPLNEQGEPHGDH